MAFARPPVTATALAGLLLGGASAFSFGSPAHAQDAVRVAAERYPQYGRVLLTWPDAFADAPLEPTAEVENGVLIVRLPRAVNVDLTAIREDLAGRAALVRLDPGGRVIRIALTRDVRAHVSQSYNVVAVDLVDPEAEDPEDVVSPREHAERLADVEARERALEEAARVVLPDIRLPLRLRVAQATEYARISFEWGEPVGFDLVRAPDGVIVRFERDAEPELAPLRVDPPRGVTGVEARHEGDRLQVGFGLEEDMTARAWSDGERVIVDVMAASADMDSVDSLAALAVSLHASDSDEAVGAALTPPPTPIVLEPETDVDDTAEALEVAQAPPPAPPRDPSEVEDIPLLNTRAFDESDAVDELTRDPYEYIETAVEPVETIADPIPESGVVRPTVTLAGADAHLTFEWRAPVGTAAFRRGDSIWLVFDAPAQIDLQDLRDANLRQFSDAQVVVGEAYTAVRLTVPESTQSYVVEDGSTWTFALGESAAAPPRAVNIERHADDEATPHLFADLPTVTAIHGLFDEQVGDVLIVATALGPAQGLLSGRTFLEISALPSVHGLGFERAADSVTVEVAEGDGVRIERDHGMVLSLGPSALESDASGEVLEASPGFVDFMEWSVPVSEFSDTQDALLRAVATGHQPNVDRMALARLLVAHELGVEALGVLRIALEEDPALLDEAHFRILRAVSNILVNRHDEAERDLNARSLADDAAAAPWRGYVAAQLGDWREARRQFAASAVEISRVRPDWRGRFLVAEAEAALQLNDLAGAKAAIEAAYAQEVPEDVRLRAALMEARFFAATGEPRRALTIADRVAAAGHEPLEVAALFEATQLRLQLGEITAPEALEQLEALRYRWRGDNVELEIVRALGAMYIDAGELRGGMQLMDAAAERFPESPIARDLYTDMSGAFRRLFLDGEADQLDPIEALALWYEFNDLTPVGAEGDRMLRRLADRLVDFDLLDQAAELLAYQVDNRLRGVARAQVATDLAAIYLMDQRPEDALNTLRQTRIAGTPEELVAERRLLEGRALADLGRFDLALELLQIDRSARALPLKADIAWEGRSWRVAADLLERVAGDRWESEDPLPNALQAAVLRAAVAYSLSEDAGSVRRLAERFDAKMASGPHAASWRTVTGELDVDGVVLRDIASRVAETATFDAFLEEFRNRRALEVEAEARAAAANAAGVEAAETDEGDVL